MIGIRYGLLAYVYSEFMKAALNSEMYAKPLAFVYEEDEYAKEVEDQLVIGDEIMLAPIYTQNAKGRYVYLPEDMMAVKMRSLEEYDCKVLEKGHHYVEVELNEMLFFIRPNCIVPMTYGGESTEQVDMNTLKVLGYVKDKAKYQLYTDDGVSKDYGKKENFVEIKADKNGKVTTSNADIIVKESIILKGQYSINKIAAIFAQEN